VPKFRKAPNFRKAGAPDWPCRRVTGIM
jgi:hypothetical protein